jgi:predicted kinase
MRKKFIAVIGYRRSGKSTIIRSLTGCESGTFVGEVRDAAAHLSIFVHAPSPQEFGKTDEGVFNEYLQRCKRRQQIQGLVSAIQPTFPSRRLSLEQMFSLASRHGFESYAFILEHPYKGGKIKNFERIKNRVLKIDSDARVLALDGRRFAILNADVIRSLCRLPF